MGLTSTTSWQILTEILKAVALFTLIVTIMRMRIARREHLVNVYIKLFEKMDVSRIREARRWIYHRFESGATYEEEWAKRKIVAIELATDAEAREKVEELIRAFDELGLMVREGTAPINVVARFYASPAIRCWYILTPYILQVREKRKQSGHLWEWENLVSRIIVPSLSKNGLWKGVSRHDQLEEWAKRINDDVARPDFKQWSDQEYKPGVFLWKLRRYSIKPWCLELW